LMIIRCLSGKLVPHFQIHYCRIYPSTNNARLRVEHATVIRSSTFESTIFESTLQRSPNGTSHAWGGSDAFQALEPQVYHRKDFEALKGRHNFFPPARLSPKVNPTIKDLILNSSSNAPKPGPIGAPQLVQYKKWAEVYLFGPLLLKPGRSRHLKTVPNPELDYPWRTLNSSKVPPI
jgi:hypothetical protein